MEFETVIGNEINTNPEYKNRFARLIDLIKKNKTKEIEAIIKQIPNSSKNDIIWKLGRYKYKKYPATNFALNKLRTK